MVYVATHVENIMGSAVEVTSYSNIKGRKRGFQMVCFYDCISAYKSKTTFMGLDFEADKSITNTTLTVMMAEL